MNLFEVSDIYINMKLRVFIVTCLALLCIVSGFQVLSGLYIYREAASIEGLNQMILDELALGTKVSVALAAMAVMLATIALMVIRVRIIGGLDQLLVGLKSIEASGPGTLLEPWSEDEFKDVVSKINVLSFALEAKTFPREYLYSSIESVATPVLLIDDTGYIQYKNQSASEILEVEPGELDGGNIGDLFRDNPDFPDMLAKVLIKDSKEQKLKSDKFDFEIHSLTPPIPDSQLYLVTVGNNR